MSMPKRPPNGWPWERPDWTGFSIGWPPGYEPQPLEKRSSVDMRDKAAHARQMRLEAGDSGTYGFDRNIGKTPQVARPELGMVKLPGRGGRR